jgi:hypothetical protein
LPTISRFYGILIRMYYGDHYPPHFHAVYGEHEAVIGIQDSAILGGDLPPRALALAREWARIHQVELEEEWARAGAKQPLLPISPLE